MSENAKFTSISCPSVDNAETQTHAGRLAWRSMNRCPRWEPANAHVAFGIVTLCHQRQRQNYDEQFVRKENHDFVFARDNSLLANNSRQFKMIQIQLICVIDSVWSACQSATCHWVHFPPDLTQQSVHWHLEWSCRSRCNSGWVSHTHHASDWRCLSWLWAQVLVWLTDTHFKHLWSLPHCGRIHGTWPEDQNCRLIQGRNVGNQSNQIRLKSQGNLQAWSVQTIARRINPIQQTIGSNGRNRR